MDGLIVLLIIVAILLIYQLGFRKDEDKLDNTGHPVRKKKK
jgi:hypothetical protein